MLLELLLFLELQLECLQIGLLFVHRLVFAGLPRILGERIQLAEIFELCPFLIGVRAIDLRIMRKARDLGEALVHLCEATRHVSQAHDVRLRQMDGST